MAKKVTLDDISGQLSLTVEKISDLPTKDDVRSMIHDEVPGIVRTMIQDIVPGIVALEIKPLTHD